MENEENMRRSIAEAVLEYVDAAGLDAVLGDPALRSLKAGLEHVVMTKGTAAAGQTDAEILAFLAKRARYESPSWGYHKGYHTVHVEAPGNWEPGKQDTAPDTDLDFRRAIVQAMNPAPRNTSK